jgi:diadenosine tetraphosphate (Ap4A) HIT family hydrolase
MKKRCTFCDTETVKNQEISVMGTVRVIYPRRPIIPASVLITPVRCVEHVHDLTEEEVRDVFRAAKELHEAFTRLYVTTGYNMFVNDGVSAGQHVPHVHFHFYGRSTDEHLNPITILNDKEKYDARPAMPESEHAAHIQNIREALQNI